MKKIFTKYKYELMFFAAACSNLFMLLPRDEVFSDVLYPLFLVDYKAGFISRTLIGTIIGTLSEHPTKVFAAVFQTVAVVIAFILLSLLLGKTVRECDDKYRTVIAAAGMILCVFPFGVSDYVNLFELLDIYWFIDVLLILYCAKYKYLRFAIPVLVFFGFYTHYAFLFAFVPVVYIVCLYLCLKERSKSSYVLAGLMVAVSVGSALYFFINARNTALPYEQLLEYIKNKAGDELLYPENYFGSTFRDYKSFNDIYQFFDESVHTANPFNILVGNVYMVWRYNKPERIIYDLLLILPVVAIFEYIWDNAIGSSKDKPHRFMYFLCMITPLVALASMFMSTDSERWCSQMIISQFLLLFWFVSEKSEPVLEATGKLGKAVKRHPLIYAALFAVYAALIFVW